MKLHEKNYFKQGLLSQIGDKLYSSGKEQVDVNSFIINLILCIVQKF